MLMEEDKRKKATVQRQRNILVAVCVILLAAVVFLGVTGNFGTVGTEPAASASDPSGMQGQADSVAEVAETGTEAADTDEPVGAEEHSTGEEVRPSQGNYVASADSDKYHLPSWSVCGRTSWKETGVGYDTVPQGRTGW